MKPKQTLLFVCHANVCRSPMMAFEFVRPLGESAEGWDAISAGTFGAETQPICSAVDTLIGDDESARRFIEQHRPRPLDDQLLADAQLIIVATRAERAHIAAMEPVLRSRAFTLREAIVLGRAPRQAEEQSSVPHRAWSLTSYAELLNARRGVASGAVSRRRWSPVRRDERSHPWDVPDVHHASARSHRQGLQRLQRDVRDFRRQVSADRQAHSMR